MNVVFRRVKRVADYRNDLKLNTTIEVLVFGCWQEYLSTCHAMNN